MATMFPEKGTKIGYTVVPREEEIKTGLGPGPIDIPIHKVLAKPVDMLDKYLGWIVPFNERKKEPGLTKPPEEDEKGAKKVGAYSRGDFGIGPGTATYEQAYANLAEDLRRHGYRLNELPEGEMLQRFDDPDGYETGKVIYTNKDRRGFRGLKVRAHEGFTKYLRELTGMDHYDLHEIVRPLETPMAIAYERGEKNVIRSFAERAMRDLKMAA